ncbi:Membrane-associated phospholipid phosphatase [Neorhizobium galegae bv. officinalis]|uniref:Membrane-associated phospholipid phosphatase n=2 Tax=Neorhizobium galegae TaxID=399 RepID=A0A0T7GHX7_NEOGA|nr:Membrane-associated phospholipid phosphatase [Neorhizobium galegae bv. officinalis]
MQRWMVHKKQLTQFVVDLARGCACRLRKDALLYVLIGLYSLGGLIFLGLTDMTAMISHHLYFQQWPQVFAVVMPVMAIVIDLSILILRFDRRRRLAYRRTFSARRIASLLSGVLLMMALMVFQGTFTSIKNALPALEGGFQYDKIQADIDAWLSFGIDPWRLLHAVAGYDVVRTIVEFNYNVVWFIICFGTLFFVLTSPSADGIRQRYMLFFLFVWIMCGNVLAGTFLSAGPAFYGAVTGDHARFAALTAFLAPSQWASSAANYQSYLWSLYEEGKPGFGGGISAFPSVHVGLITLNAFFLAERSRRLAIVGFVYVGFIQLSSVYLGWHYAIDGYVSFIVVTLAYFSASALRPIPFPLARRSDATAA